MLENLDHRKAYYIVLDTETCPIDKELDEVSPFNMFTYDCGWAVVDKKGNVYRTKSYVNADIFLDEKSLMKSAYYSKKIPNYWNDIKNGQRILTSFAKIHKDLLADMEDFGVKKIFAHNMFFDYNTLNTTERWLTKSKYRYFFPYGTVICDTLKMSRDVIAKMPTYKYFCENHNFLTANGQPRLTAEIIYRYITNDLDFVEKHTGLEDVMIEKEILAYCFRQHKKMRQELWNRG